MEPRCDVHTRRSSVAAPSSSLVSSRATGVPVGLPGPGLGVFGPVAPAIGLDDPTPMGEPVEGDSGEPLGAEDLDPGPAGNCW